MSYAIQRKDGVEQNKLYSDDTSIHDWYRFVLSYPPHLVRRYLDKFLLQPGDTVLDPFCGTGTTLVECKKNNISSIGIEPNPVVHMAASAKVNWNVDVKKLEEHSYRIARRYDELIKQYGKNLKKLPPEKEKLLIKNSISPLPLHKSLVLIEAINELRDDQFFDIERTALAKQLVFSYSNLHFGPEVGVKRKKMNDVDAIGSWLNQIKKMIEDLKEYSHLKNTQSVVHLGDSRNIGTAIKNNTINAIITSPPYPNEKDYTRTTRLESVLLGFINNKEDLRNHKQSLLRSNTRNIYKNDNDEKWVEKYDEIMDLANKIESKRIEMKKTSGFEKQYHKVVRNYFGGMARHLEELKPFLKPGAKLAYVVGDQASYFQIPIRTGTLLANIAVDLGYDLIDIELFRTRLSTATKEQLREEVVLLKWKGK